MEGAAAAARAGVDPVTVQVIRNKVGSLVDEMHYHFYRSGYSTIIRESRDFSCVILDRRGRGRISARVSAAGRRELRGHARGEPGV